MDKKTEAKMLLDWINSFPMSDFRRRTKEISEACQVPLYTFHNWKYGKCRIPGLAKSKIEEMAGKKLFSESTTLEPEQS